MSNMTKAELDKLVDRFLSWPLPNSVMPDRCVMYRDYPHRVGTNLLTADETRAMLEYVLADQMPEGGEAVAERIAYTRRGRDHDWHFDSAVDALPVGSKLYLRPSPRPYLRPSPRPYLRCQEIVEALEHLAEYHALRSHHHRFETLHEAIKLLKQGAEMPAHRVDQHGTTWTACSTCGVGDCQVLHECSNSSCPEYARQRSPSAMPKVPG